ncbi:hypothetical protein PAAG_02711 [Paracoccidioides lutzii Pb01]|uniref:BTB domain-containing protein n=1 Tax=Paracoccidioides lutzii (strain ATCC MYA-826 / Pb01) TaxID=502779 RepID=C1GW16_PARBA|nr:hypothetical protein PAAG_02711 [Paracoccidioides lutzii Pb01]EEH40735.2 hypothetical protein PAAG_02711 [Paracoccidioides lutzii Pb01]
MLSQVPNQLSSRAHPTDTISGDFLALPPSQIGSPRKVGSKIPGETVSREAEWLQGLFGRYFDSQPYSDVTLYLGPRKVKVHAHYEILNMLTPYFDKARRGGFKEGITNEFYFTEHNPHALYRMLQYIYTSDYSQVVNQLNDAAYDPELLMHTQVYILADYFDVIGLRGLAFIRFARVALVHWERDSQVESIDFTHSYSDTRRRIIPAFTDYVVEQHEKAGFGDFLDQHDGFVQIVVELMFEFRKPYLFPV